MSILLSPEQEQQGLKDRMGKFVTGVQALQAEHKLELVAKIREDGPIIEVINKKNENQTA